MKLRLLSSSHLAGDERIELPPKVLETPIKKLKFLEFTQFSSYPQACKTLYKTLCISIFIFHYEYSLKKRNQVPFLIFTLFFHQLPHKSHCFMIHLDILSLNRLCQYDVMHATHTTKSNIKLTRCECHWI